MATRVSKGFNDISLSFAKHPVTNDILVLKNEDAIKRAVQNLIQTNIGERYYNRNLGTTVNESLFELTTMETSTILKEEIKDVIKKDKRFFGEEKMKLPIKIVEEMVEKYPNDMELGSRVRWYINWLNETKSKDKEYNDKDKTWRP